MEQYIVSARKYRPSTFDSVVGQKALTATLKNAIATNRLAHAYLFCGSRGVGKTSCARIFAKTINCMSRSPRGEACNECDSCRQFNENRSMNIIELDAASHNGVDDMRALTEQVMVPPAIGKYRVFIIDEVHMLTSAAFNAFLKTLEEPPAHAIFILATTEKHKIIPTILSRCQIFDFNRIGVADMVAHMQQVAHKEGIAADAAALNVIARKADGAMRDALSIFDQVAASSQGNITYAATIENLNILDESYYNRLTDAFVAQDVAQALLIYKEVRDKGFDSQFFINGLALYLRDLMAAANPATACLVEASDDVRATLAERAARLSPAFLYRAMDLCNDADFNFRQASNKQFLIELTLIKLCQLLSPSSIDSGDDEGRLKPLPAAATPLKPQNAAPAPDVAAAAAQDATVTPAKTASDTPKPRFAPGNFSLRGSMAAAKANADKPAAAAAASPRRTAPFTEADLHKAWKEFIGSHPGEPLLTGSMESALPADIGDGRYVLTMASTVLADQINARKGEVLAALRDALGNDDVDFEVAVSSGDLAPQYWPEKRVLDYMLEHHPRMSELMQKFKMRLQ